MSFALPTAAEYGANILIVIMNNDTFGQTFMQQKTIYGHTFGTTFTCPDFAAMARSCGAEGIRVSDPAQVGDAMREGLEATKNRPELVEIMTGDSPFPSLKGVKA
jgi:thiamine pyrophosphate-dependent acetolactate synthase large subunit-like protein